MLRSHRAMAMWLRIAVRGNGGYLFMGLSGRSDGHGYFLLHLNICIDELIRKFVVGSRLVKT
jgi:hypothetical protein